MLFIRKLIWDAWNIQHIARHHITQDEVEEICHGFHIILRGQKKGRLILIGETEAKRIIGVVIETKGGEIYYPVTAYETDKQDTTLYKHLRGGEK